MRSEEECRKALQVALDKATLAKRRLREVEEDDAYMATYYSSLLRHADAGAQVLAYVLEMKGITVAGVKHVIPKYPWDTKWAQAMAQKLSEPVKP